MCLEAVQKQHSRYCPSLHLILLSVLFFLQCDYSDSTVSFYITVVEHKTWPPVFTDEIMTPEYRFLALLVAPQLLIFQFFRNFHGVNVYFCAPPVVAIPGTESSLWLHLPQELLMAVT